MSGKERMKKMKEIDMETLNSTGKKARTRVARKVAVAFGIVALVSAVGWGAHRVVAGGVLSTKYTVNKMTCPGCVTRITAAVSGLRGVVECAVNLAASETVVTFRDKETDSDAIEKAISDMGYAVELDGVFKPSGKGVDRKVLATVNGSPIFQTDVGLPIFPEEKGSAMKDPASAFFDSVGKSLLVQAADKNMVFARPHEIRQEIDRIRSESGVTAEEMKARVLENCGTLNQYTKIVSQRIGIRKLIDQKVLAGVQDADQRKTKTVQWLSDVFRTSTVEILDSDLKKDVEKAAGKDEWNLFWPKMIARDTELKRAFLR